MQENPRYNGPQKRKADRIASTSSTTFTLVGMPVDEYIEAYGDDIITAYKRDGLAGAYSAIRASVSTGSIGGLDFKGIRTTAGLSVIPVFTLTDEYGNKGIIDPSISTVHEPSSMKATVETKAPPNTDIIGPSAGKYE